MNRLTTVTTPISGDTTVYGYDSGGNQITVTDGLGHTAPRHSTMPSIGRRRSIERDFRGTTMIAYDAGGTRNQSDRPRWQQNAVGL